MEQLLLPFFDGSVPSELAADYILPDTYPDVKRILRVRARPIMIGRFISGGKLEYNGAVDYVVVFSTDGENSPDALHAVHFAAEFNGAVTPDDLSLLADSCEIVISPMITACSARLQNPRKLSLRSTVVSDVKLSRMTSSAPKLEGAFTADDELQLERLTKAAPTLLEKVFTADHQQLSENLEPDPSQPAIDEIVTCDAEFHFCEAKPQQSDDGLTVAVKGEALIDCIYKAQTEPGDYRSFTRKIPISCIVDAGEFAGSFKNAKPGTLCAVASGTLSELNAAVGENSYGERRVLELDLSFDIELRLCADAETQLTLDVYSTRRDSKVTMRRLELACLGKTLSSNFTVNESVTRDSLGLPGESEQLSAGQQPSDQQSADLPADMHIVDAQTEIRMNTAEIDRGRVRLGGEATVSCILSDRRSFVPVDLKLPIKCELSVGDLSEPICFVCDSKAADMRARLDRSRLSLDFEVALNLVLMKRSRCDAVECVTLSDELRPRSEDKASLLLCYPDPGESLWQIAKRYNTTCAAITALNPTAPARVLLIPSTSSGVTI